MATRPNHRRTRPDSGQQISDSTSKNQSKSSTTTTPTAVYNLTNHFSKLQPKPTNPQNTLLQVKAFSKSANFDRSKIKHGEHGKRVVLESDGNNTNKNKSLVVFEERKDLVKKKGNKEGTNNGVVKFVNRKMMGGSEKIERRSFCDVKMELGNFLLTNCAKVVSADMPPFMQIHAVGFARKTKDSLEKFTSKSLALSLKREFDGVYGPAWHCVVGTSFGSFVTHSVGGFLYFALDQKLFILFFKTTVHRAD